MYYNLNIFIYYLKSHKRYSNGNSFDGMVNIRLIRDYKAPNKDGDKLEKKQDVLFEDDFKVGMKLDKRKRGDFLTIKLILR